MLLNVPISRYLPVDMATLRLYYLQLSIDYLRDILRIHHFGPETVEFVVHGREVLGHLVRHNVVAEVKVLDLHPNGALLLQLFPELVALQVMVPREDEEAI
jgi:hypothetical protein